MRVAIFSALVVLTVLQTGGEARDPEPVVPEARPVLRIRAQAHAPDSGGGVGIGYGMVFDRPGTPITGVVLAGPPQVPSLCVLESRPDLAGVQARAYWAFTATLGSADLAGATVDLAWKRVVADASEVEGGTIERNVRLRMVEGGRVPLDYLRTRNQAGDPPCEGVSVGLELEFDEPPGVERALFEYDVWLVQQNADGSEDVDRLRMRGLQGAAMDYTFRPLRYDLEGRRDPEGPLMLDVGGTVKARARSDGRIDLHMTAARTTGTHRTRQGDGGAKQTSLRQGETLELVLPAHAGELRGLGDLASVFAGHRTALRVTVRRVG